MYVYHPRGVFLAGLKEFYTLILKFVYITFCLLMEPDYVAAEDFDDIDLILLLGFS